MLSFMESYPDSAEKMGQLDLQISWLTFALKLLERSEDTKKKKKVRKKVSEAQEAHDRYIVTEGKEIPIFGCVHNSFFKDWLTLQYHKSLSLRRPTTHSLTRALKKQIHTRLDLMNTGN